MKKLIPALIAVLFLFISTAPAQTEDQFVNINFERAVFNLNNVSSVGGGAFVLNSSNSSLVGTVREGYFGPATCVPCLAGEELNLNSVFGGDLSIIGGHPGLINGTLYNTVYYSGSLNFNGGQITLPHRYNRAKFTITAPATLTGVLNGYTTNPTVTPSPMVFTSQINLSGTATVTLMRTGTFMSANGMKPSYRILNVKYEFSNTAESKGIEASQN